MKSLVWFVVYGACVVFLSVMKVPVGGRPRSKPENEPRDRPSPFKKIPNGAFKGFEMPPNVGPLCPECRIPYRFCPCDKQEHFRPPNNDQVEPKVSAKTEKLQAIEALIHRGTTEGERQAARNAWERNTGKPYEAGATPNHKAS